MSISILHNSQSAPLYLDLCKSELDPSLAMIYSKESELEANLALVYCVAFPIIIATSLAITATFAPVFLIVTGFTALLLIYPLKEIYSNTAINAELKEARFRQLKSLQKHYESLAQATPAQIQQMLKEKGIDFVIGMGQNDPQLTTLKPMLARYLFWEERITELKKSQEKKLRRAETLTTENAEQNKIAISNLQRDALNIESQLVTAKVKCAFVNAALFHPTCKGCLENIGTFSTLSGEERAIALGAKASKANDFFLFNQPHLSAITFEDAKRCTIRQLGMRLYPHIQR